MEMRGRAREGEQHPLVVDKAKSKGQVPRVPQNQAFYGRAEKIFRISAEKSATFFSKRCS
jgi:hypothetical protein